MAFSFSKLFFNVFSPQQGEVVTFMIDEPHGDIKDTITWADRRKMANEWRNDLIKVANSSKLKVNPIVVYGATGKHNADLPEEGIVDGKKVKVAEVVLNSNIIVAMPEFSPTAPLITYAKKAKSLRIASMPGVERRMQDSGLAANYPKIAKRCNALQPVLEKADGGKVEFSSGHSCFFDLRFRRAHKDDGVLSLEAISKKEFPLCNLPSGEVFKVPYEGEKPNIPSKTCGGLPIMINGELVVFEVVENKIAKVVGDGKEADRMLKYLNVDEARRNVAEFGIGCNDKAVVKGNGLEDEKALGFHWACGRSDHIGGGNGVANFKSPANVVHDDFIYSKDSPIYVNKLTLFYDGDNRVIIRDGIFVF